MYVEGRLGSDPCCECEVEGNYGVQACSCRGQATAIRRCSP